MLGVFAAQDLILFYVFFEITLIPMYLLVGIWGDENRRRRDQVLHLHLPGLDGDARRLPGLRHPRGYLLDGRFERGRRSLAHGPGRHRGPILFGLLVKVPAVPLHGWLLDVYVSSPISTTWCSRASCPSSGPTA